MEIEDLIPSLLLLKLKYIFFQLKKNNLKKYGVILIKTIVCIYFILHIYTCKNIEIYLAMEPQATIFKGNTKKTTLF